MYSSSLLVSSLPFLSLFCKLSIYSYNAFMISDNAIYEKKPGLLFTFNSTRKTPLIDSITSLNDCELSGASRPSAYGGPGHPDPEIREGGFSKKEFFSAFGLHFALKNGWGGGGALGPSPGSATGTSLRSGRDSGRQVRCVVQFLDQQLSLRAAKKETPSTTIPPAT